jgi:hypothetical protein
MATARKRQPLFSSEQQIKAERKRLPMFEAHDLRSLINEAKASEEVDVDRGFILAVRRRTENQMKELLRHLGIDPSQPDAWQRGFLLLAFYRHGVGQVAWYPRRTNQNSATWTPSHDLALIREVTILGAQGLSERKAVKKIASDPKRREMFPYRRKGHYPTERDKINREDALWSRLHELKSRSSWSRIERIFGIHRTPLSFIERILRDFDTAISISLPDEVVKNKRPLKEARS